MDNVSMADAISMIKKDIQAMARRLDDTESLHSNAKEVLTVEEAAKFLGLSKSFVNKMTHEGALPFYKPNGKVCYFERACLLEWMRSNKVATKKEVREEAKQILQQLAEE